jgi:hypothetical protein
LEPPCDDVNHKNARESELKQNGTQIQVKETTLQVRGFARTQNHRRSRFFLSAYINCSLCDSGQGIFKCCHIIAFS